jgi:hypothetical protein
MKISVTKLLLFSIAYLFIPHLIFILGWVKLSIALPTIALLFFLSYKIAKQTYTDDAVSENITLSKPTALYLITFSLVMVGFSGIGELVWQRDDFFKHNLIFSDLLRSNWPVTYADKEVSSILTYYLGWYMVPAAIGKVAGVWATAFTSFLWTAIGSFLLFLWLKLVLKTSNLLLWIVFLGISGFEFLWVAGHYIYYLFTYYPQYGFLALLKGTFAYTRSELITPYFNQNIPSFFVGFLSAPQHVLPGFLVSAIIIYAIIKKLSFRYTAIVGVLMMFWSPIVCLGLVPFALYHIYVNKKGVFSVQNIWSYVFSGVILFFVVSYLVAHAPLKNNGFVWQVNSSNWLFYTIVFIALKFGVIFLYLSYKNKKLDFIGEYKELGYLSVFGLVVLSVYKLGAYNDLIARASIPFYFVLLIWVVFFLQRIKEKPFKKYVFVWGIVALMLIPRLWQVYKTIVYTPQLKSKKYTISDVPREYNILNHNEWLIQIKPEYLGQYVIDDSISSQYLGSTNSFFYNYLAKNELEN